MNLGRRHPGSTLASFRRIRTCRRSLIELAERDDQLLAKRRHGSRWRCEGKAARRSRACHRTDILQPRPLVAGNLLRLKGLTSVRRRENDPVGARRTVSDGTRSASQPAVCRRWTRHMRENERRDESRSWIDGPGFATIRTCQDHRIWIPSCGAVDDHAVRRIRTGQTRQSHRLPPAPQPVSK